MNHDAFRDSTIVFDLDGTLVDTAPDLIDATNHALRLVGLAPRPGAELRPWIGHGGRRMVFEALAASGHDTDDTVVDRLLAEFLAYYEANIARESRPFPGSLQVVQMLRDAGARTAICTNKRQMLTNRLIEELDIAHLFDAIVGRGSLPVSKPHPDHLTATIDRAGGSRSRAVMIGDSGVDVETARAARIPVVAVTFGYSEVPVADLAPDAVISGYDELLAHLGRLLKV